MNDRLLDNAELADRISRSLRSIADTHQPKLPGPVDSSVRSRTSRRPWLLGAAASLIVVAGVASLVVAQRRDGGGLAPLDSTGATSLPANTTVDRESFPAPVEPADSLRFDEPLADDVLAGLVPAPSGRGTAIVTHRPSLEYLSGYGTSIPLAVLDADGVPIGFFSVIDTAIPPAAFSDSDVRKDGAVRYVVDDSDPQTMALLDGNIVRLLTGTGSDGKPLAVPDDDVALEVASYVAGTPLEQLVATERFLPLPASWDWQASGAVHYPLSDGGTVDTIRFGFDQVLTSAQLGAVSAMFGANESTDGVRFTGQLEATGQTTYIEQVSPRNLVVVLAPATMPDADRLALVGTLAFGTAEELDLDVEIDDPFAGTDDVLQAEESWGRWQVTESVEGGERCFGLGVNVWGSDGARSAHSLVCQPEIDELPGPMCLDLSDNRYAEVTSDGTTPDNPAVSSTRDFRAGQLTISLVEHAPEDKRLC